MSLVGERERKLLKDIVKKANNPVKSRIVPQGEMYSHLHCCSLKPGSYFMRMRSEFDVNLASQPSFRCEFCDVNIHFACAFVGSMNRALLV